ncbi:hypothetical protein FEM48_Zijuj07G0158100 [Ziziphus jujuba var. spinosa]|uniref:Pentatricopeptide repeat-containing protein n=1 Tax=Ziziphus jujuba var. spinosa TaxID=714518 RepID=A0A978V5I7_ZIZJJ|nr:hypothetical protein FEM48_Zijuj07G0158100 [Ziziphus jujuba var. spinosa]
MKYSMLGAPGVEENVPRLFLGIGAKELHQRESENIVEKRSGLCSTCSKFESNRLLNELNKSGRIDEARKVFNKMLDRDEFTWNTMIAAFANSGRLDEARKLFDESPIRSSITWSSLISGYCRNGCEVEAFELFWRMQLEGKMPSQGHPRASEIYSKLDEIMISIKEAGPKVRCVKKVNRIGNRKTENQTLLPSLWFMLKRLPKVLTRSVFFFFFFSFTAGTRLNGGTDKANLFYAQKSQRCDPNLPCSMLHLA